jgi:hypothetical protein
MVGIVSASVTAFASAAGTISSTISPAPAASSARVGDQLRGGGVLAPLHPVATELVDRLRQQADMSTHRNAALGQKGDRVHHDRAALELDHVRACRHQPRTGGKRTLERRLVAAERQVGDDEGVLGAGRHAARVIRHFGQLHRQRGSVTLHHHAERIADQQHLDAGAIEHARKAGVVAGEYGDLLAALAQRFEGGQGDAHVTPPG